MRESISSRRMTNAPGVIQNAKVKMQMIRNVPTSQCLHFASCILHSGCRLFQQPARRVVSITASLLTGAPASALACPVCGLIGTSNNTWAYQAMTAMLTLLPLAMVGATVWWLARLAARADTERPSATQPVIDHAPLGFQLPRTRHEPDQARSAPGGARR